MVFTLGALRYSRARLAASLVIVVVGAVAGCRDQPTRATDRSAAKAHAVTSPKRDAAPAKPGPAKKPKAQASPKPAPPRAKGCPAPLRKSLASRATWTKRDRRTPIVDGEHNLQRFFRAWTQLVIKPDPGQNKLRVAIYGDSNTQGDWAASFLRKLLGKQIGIGGHGFVGLGKPNPWYEHRAIRTTPNKQWRTFSVSPHSGKTSAPLGHSGLVSVGKNPGASVAIRPAMGAESPVVDNERFSRMEVHYLCHPQGGSFRVTIDNKRVRDVDTKCATPKYSTVTLRTKLDRHRVKLVTQTSRVVVFGAVFENDEPGIVIDGIGINTGNYKWLLRADEAMFKAGLQSRKYDLVVLATGISMWSELDHFGLAQRLIGRIRSALGNDVSILVMPPGPWGDRKGDKAFLRSHILRVVKEKREVAARNRAAFWDYFAAIGGKRALSKLIENKQIYRDLLHFPPITHQRMMRRLSVALNVEYAHHLKRAGYDCQ